MKHLRKLLLLSMLALISVGAKLDAQETINAAQKAAAEKVAAEKAVAEKAAAEKEKSSWWNWLFGR